MRKGKPKNKIHKGIYYFLNRQHPIVLPNLFYGRYEMDVFCLTSKEYIYEYEVKVSRDDFKIDFLKSSVRHQGIRTFKHDEIKNGHRANKFYFVCPYGLISKDEVPDYAGLVYSKDDVKFETIKRAPLLHGRTPDLRFYKHLCKTMAFREMNIRAKFYRS